MELFSMVFNKAYIADTLFINIKSVLEYPTLEALSNARPDLQQRWNYISEKYNKDSMSDPRFSYLKKAPYYPEFCKIVAITYGTVKFEETGLKRTMQSLFVDKNNDELSIIKKFHEVLCTKYDDAHKSEPKFSYILCGHNIVGYDIPLFIKRLVLYRKEMIAYNKQLNSKQDVIPKIIKDYLAAKPWENNVIDTVNIWKFNGLDYNTLMLISDFMGLKKTTDSLLPNDELSQYYWDSIDSKPEETIKFITNQSANQTNMVIQLINELRLL
jgi:hypothetical protein